MVATLQKLQPPRAMRWVTRWRWITASLLAAAVAVFFFFPHWSKGIGLIFLAVGGWAFTVAQHRSRIVGEGSEGEALTAKTLDNMTMENARVLHSVQFESGDKPRELDHLLITPNTLFVI